tara:strand:- start:45 stop:605 length:561 start_codon:yes stop_codon:yes gene_type:complete
MATKTIAQLKTGRDFVDVLDSALNLTDGGAVTGAFEATGGMKTGDAKVLAAGAGQTLAASDSGKTIIFGAAAATLIKLPAPELGMVFNFVTAVTATGDHEIQALTDTHGFLGGVSIVSTSVGESDAFAAAAAGTDDFITMNGTTKGGAAGSGLRIVAILDASAVKCWAVTGTLIGSGTIATPFAAS